MIKQLTQSDNDKLLELVSSESEVNLFIIGDIENFGYDKDFQKLWGEFDTAGNIIAVLLKYYKSFIFYSRAEYDKNGFCEIMNNEEFNILSGESSIIEGFQEEFQFSNITHSYLCKLDHLPFSQATEEVDLMIEKVELENLDEAVDGILDIYTRIEEFRTPQLKEEAKKKFETNSGRAYYIKQNGKIVSVAQTTAENSLSAMIVGVCTHPEYRQKGYASTCMEKLCSELINEGKSLCLFYNNPEAGKIYKRLGFVDVGKWSMYVK